VNTRSSGSVAEQCYFSGIASEGGDILTDPSEGCDLIHQAEVAQPAAFVLGPSADV